MGVFAASWVVTALELLLRGQTQSHTLAFFAIMLSAVVLALAVASIRAKPLLSGLLVLAFARFAVEIIVELAGGSGWHTLLTVIGIALAAFSVYGGLAFLLEDVRRRAVLPVFRRGSSRESLEGDLAAQLRQIADEAGVRQTL